MWRSCLRQTASFRFMLVPVVRNNRKTLTGVRLQSNLPGTQKSSNIFSSEDDDYFSKTYRDHYLKSINFPEEYWAEAAGNIDWMRKWDKVLDSSNPPFNRWFVGGTLNVCYNAVDRHAESDYKDNVAIFHESPVTGKSSQLTWAELKDQVSRFAGVLTGLGTTKGDRVIIYMPMIPEAVIAMLACARIGAVHSVVFGGYSARELAVRLEHAKPKIIVGVNASVERNKILNFKRVVDEAIGLCPGCDIKHAVIFNRPQFEPAEMMNGRDVDWDRGMESAVSHPCVPVDANDPLYVLYTSGTTGQPKGIVRPSGGHAVVLPWTMDKVYGMKPQEVWWAASDLGWVVGHSFICYGPLLAGISTIIYEGKPVGTPDASQFFRVIQDRQVNGMFTAPTALRAIKAEDPQGRLSAKFSRESLRYVFVAGEHCDYETREWAQKEFKVPVLDNWWQTETGHPITATCVGFNNSLNPPKDVSGMPLPGYDVRIMRQDRTEADYGEMGRIVIKSPLPPGNMTTLYESPDRFVKTYFSEYPGFYDTMDAGFKDEHGYVCVMSRDDDVINVAGHRLSTSAIEEAVLEHNDVIDCAVIGVPDDLKGEVPLALFVGNAQSTRSEEQIVLELREVVRQIIGPVAAFRLAAQVPALPRTRSGKTPRKTLSDLARSKQVVIPGTVEDPSVYAAIKEALQRLGYATNAPDPE